MNQGLQKRSRGTASTDLLAILIPCAIGTLLGYLIGKNLPGANDGIFHPVLWTTPLGLFSGIVVAATLGSIARWRRGK